MVRVAWALLVWPAACWGQAPPPAAESVPPPGRVPPPPPMPATKGTAATPAKAQAARERIMQSAYELGLHLALGETAAATEQMRALQSALSRARRDFCPPGLAHAVHDAAAGNRTTLPGLLDKLGAELAALPEGGAPAGAQERFAAARAAFAAGQPQRVGAECTAIVDHVAGKALDLPLPEWVEGLRQARKALTANPGPAELAAALAILKKQPGTETFRRRAYEDALRRADDGVAAAMDLYAEYAYLDANAALQQCRVPMQLAGRATDDAAAGRKLDLVWRTFADADRLIVREGNAGWHHDGRLEGIRLLRKAREDLQTLLEKPSTAAPAARPRPDSAGAAAPASGSR